MALLISLMLLLKLGLFGMLKFLYQYLVWICPSRSLSLDSLGFSSPWWRSYHFCNNFETTDFFYLLPVEDWLIYMDAWTIEIVIIKIYKKWAIRDFCEANFYLYVLILLYSCVCEGYPYEVTFHGVIVLRVLTIHQVITYMLSCPRGGINMRTYGQISCLDSVWLPLLPSEGRTL